MNRPNLISSNDNISIDMIRNTSSLNIFSDASMRTVSKREHRLASCYGAVAVYGDNIIDERYRVQSEATVPAAEMRGIRCSLSLALQYRQNFPVINLFSDSQISVFSLRDYIMNWRYNSQADSFFIKKKEVKNQELITECYFMLTELSKTNIVNIFHQSGHVGNGESELKHAADVFRYSNGVRGVISYEFIRYISRYNNYIDNNTRSVIRSTNVVDNKYIDPIYFNSHGNLSLMK